MEFSDGIATTIRTISQCHSNACTHARTPICCHFQRKNETKHVVVIFIIFFRCICVCCICWSINALFRITRVPSSIIWIVFNEHYNNLPFSLIVLKCFFLLPSVLPVIVCCLLNGKFTATKNQIDCFRYIVWIYKWNDWFGQTWPKICKHLIWLT